VPEILRGASDEMAEAADAYEGEREGLGERFLRCVQQVVGRLEKLPSIGVPWPGEVGEDVRRCAVRGFPYYVVYVTTPALTIVAVAHMRREPGYWRARLPSR
jgi:plasmid stabilization system protein ParE